MLSIYSVLLSVLIAICLQQIVSLLYRWFQALLAARKFPGLPGTKLIVGDLQHETIDEYIEKALRNVQTTGVKVNTLWIYFLFPVYSISHPDYAKVLLKSNAPKDNNVGAAYTMLRRWIAERLFSESKEELLENSKLETHNYIEGNGLLAHQGGKVWERNRHLLTPAFHFDILRDYVSVFNDVADDLLIQLSRAGSGKSIEISNPITVATLDSLLRCALSYHCNIQDAGHDHPYVDAVQKLARYFNERLTNPVLYPDFIYYRTKSGRHFKELCDYVHNFAEEIIIKRRQALQQAGTNINLDKKEGYRKRRLDFLDILLTAKDDQSQGLTDLEIRSEVDTFMFAGHDTTSAAMSWAVHALAKYPDIQDRVHDEIVQVIGDRPIAWDDISSLKYFTLFIKEVMRMYSIVPVIGRLTDEPMKLDGYTIPANSIVELNIHAINHRPDVWPDYDEFRPERFEETMTTDRDPFSFIPFSAGTRNCIGQNFATNEIKVIISRLIQTYRIELDKQHEAMPSSQLIMRPKNGINVILHPR